MLLEKTGQVFLLNIYAAAAALEVVYGGKNY